MNCYASLATLKAQMHGMTATDNDTVLLGYLEEASREIDDWCGRHFYVQVATRYYDPPSGLSSWWLQDDVLAVTTLKVDNDDDGTYELTLSSATDYRLRPYNDFPKALVDLRSDSTVLTTFPSYVQAIELAGKFGYVEELENTGATTSEALDATETEITVTGSLAKLSPGQTYLIGTEQVYHELPIASPITARRAVNGTTAGTPDTGAVIYRYRYPRPVEQACVMHALRLFKRRESAYANVVASTDVGTYSIFRGIDPDIAKMLNRYRRLPVVA